MITSVFGISIKYEAWNQQDSLPVYIAGSYNFRTAYIGNKRCIILIPKSKLQKYSRLTMCLSYLNLRQYQIIEEKVL